MVSPEGMSAIRVMQETSRIERKVDDERRHREEALSALESRFVSEVKRVQSAANSARSSHQLQERLSISRSPGLSISPSPVAKGDISLESRLRELELIVVRLQHERGASETHSAAHEAHAHLMDELKGELAEHGRRHELHEAVRLEREAAMEAMEARLTAELAGIHNRFSDVESQFSRHGDGHESLRQRLAEHRDELDGRYDARHTELHDSIEALGARIRQDREDRFTQHGSAYQSALDHMEGKLDEEIRSLRATHKETHDAMDRFTSHHAENVAEICRSLVSDMHQTPTSRHEENRDYVEEFERDHKDHLSAFESRLHEDMDGRFRQTSASLQSTLTGHEETLLQHRQALLEMEARLTEEMNGRHGQLITMHSDAHEAWEAKFKSETRNNIGGCTADCLTILESKLQKEIDGGHDRFHASQSAALTSLDDRLQSEIGRVHSEHERRHAEGQVGLENMIRDEIDERHCKLDSDHRSSLASLEANLRQENHESLSRLESLLREDIGGGHGQMSALHKSTLESYEQMHAQHRQALVDMEANLRGEIDERHRTLDDGHNAALTALDSRLREEFNHKHQEYQQRNETLRRLISDQDELHRRHDMAHSEHREALAGLEQTLRQEIGRSHTQLADSNVRNHDKHTVALQDLGTKIREDLDGRYGHLDASHGSQIQSMEKKFEESLQSVDARIEEFLGRCSQLEAGQRSSLQSLSAELRELGKELSKKEPLAEHQDSVQRDELESLELKFRDELDSCMLRVESHLRVSVQAMEELIKLEVVHAIEQHLPVCGFKPSSSPPSYQQQCEGRATLLTTYGRVENAHAVVSSLGVEDLVEASTSHSVSVPEILEEIARKLRGPMQERTSKARAEDAQSVVASFGRRQNHSVDRVAGQHAAQPQIDGRVMELAKMLQGEVQEKTIGSHVVPGACFARESIARISVAQPIVRQSSSPVPPTPVRQYVPASAPWASLLKERVRTPQGSLSPAPGLFTSFAQAQAPPAQHAFGSFRAAVS